MTWLNRIRKWWYRRRMHPECVHDQLAIWSGGMAAHGACTKCYPRMLWIRDNDTPKARLVQGQ